MIRSVVGAGGRFGAIHSQMPVVLVHGRPGLKIVAPSTPGDAKALLRAAIDDDNPVLFFEHKRLYGARGRASTASRCALGQAAVVREGRDVTLVSAMKGVHDCLEAAERLAARGIDAEVIDLRTLRPLDADTIARVAREDEPHRRGRGGPAAPAAGPARCSRSRPSRASATSTTPGASRRPTRPVPYSPPLEDAHLPGAERIAAEIAGRLQ